MFEYHMNMAETVGFAIILLLLGRWIKRKVNFFEKFFIPAPVIGGTLFSIILLIGHQTGTFNLDTIKPADGEISIRDLLMIAFFTTVGLGASFALLKKGGKLLIIYWLVCGIISIFQNIIGITITKITGLEAPYALLSSAISMVGGHGAALAYGDTFAKMGYENAPLVGAAAATFGLITAVLIGGPLGRRLIEKNNLRADNTENFDQSVTEINTDKGEKLSDLDVIKNVVVILVCMAIGSYISTLIGKLIKMDFPSYVGAMFMAVIVRNINEKTHSYNFNFSLVDGIGNVMLNLYLALALMTLKLWELSGLIGGVLLVVACQVVFMIIIAYFVVFRILGSNYDAAVMCSGLCGHGLGATPSAIVNMTAINEKYGMSRKAMMIVPIVGAFLVDIIYQPATVWFIKTFVQNYVG